MAIGAEPNNFFPGGGVVTLGAGNSETSVHNMLLTYAIQLVIQAKVKFSTTGTGGLLVKVFTVGTIGGNTDTEEFTAFEVPAVDSDPNWVIKSIPVSPDAMEINIEVENTTSAVIDAAYVYGFSKTIT